MSGSKSSLLSKSTSGASFLILVQVVTKLATFLLNQVLFRFISPKVFGLSTYLEFLVSTLLFFSREGERLSIQRTEINNTTETVDNGRILAHTKRGSLQSIINFGFVPLCIGIPMLIAAFWWQLGTELFQKSLLPLPKSSYTIALLLLLVISELAIEPIYAINQYELNFKRRSQIEGSAVLLKCVVTFTSMILFRKYASPADFEGLAVLAFAIGQFSYSATLLVRYYLSFRIDNSLKNKDTQLKLSVERIYSEAGYHYFDPKVWAIWKSLFVQMIFKQFLTEGDKILINYLCSVEEQGVYSVISNYGSIIARLLFQPIEESMRLLFTRLLSSSGDGKTSPESYQLVKNLSIFYFNLSILILLGGFTNASFLLKTLLGNKAGTWTGTNVFEVFPYYMLYIPLLAFNGILEAFFSSIAKEADIKKFSYFMTVLTVVVLITLYVSIEKFKLGITGLIISNSINMALRITFCYRTIVHHFSAHNIQISVLSIINYTKYALAVALSLEYLQYSIIFKGKSLGSNTVADFIQSVAVCFLCLLVLCVIERKTLLAQLRTMKSKQKSA